ncbi:PadR family transcriptional regulator [Xanthobacter sp. KR7-225]|uniref:PadR family transcriptional regulator n=1 Tax=Xanthobacter sp. KR7-225 TaxID=3156613 RepID=UPI0032B31BCF
MSLKFALLGLIAIQPASGYDLKRTIERSIYYIWNATSPQIYNTLAKLREEGFITSVDLPQRSKPDKKIHAITEEGRAALQAFLNEPIRSSVTRDEVLLRIFFGNFADRATIHKELLSNLERIREECAYLESVEARITAHPGPKMEARKFQLLSLRMKVAQLRAMEEELVRFLADESALPLENFEQV